MHTETSTDYEKGKILFSHLNKIHEEEMNKLKEELKNKDNLINTLQVKIEELQHDLKHKDIVIAERDRIIADREEKLKEIPILDERIGEMEEKLKEKDGYADHLSKNLSISVNDCNHYSKESKKKDILITALQEKVASLYEENKKLSSKKEEKEGSDTREEKLLKVLRITTKYMEDFVKLNKEALDLFQ